MAKNVLLINPEWYIENKENLWVKVASCYPSLGLAYIASVLEQNNHKVSYLDMLAEGIDALEFKNMAASGRWDNIDIVGITATTPLINNALKIAEIFKKRNAEVKIVLGGVHPTVMDNEVIKNKYVDIVVRGEGEYTMLDIANDVELKEIKGITYKGRKGEIIVNPERPLIKKLDEIPPPAYHLMPIHKYRPPVGGYKRLPSMSIFATRGCPGRCTFCYRLFEGCIRYRSARKIVDEIKILMRDYGIKEINFYDDTFTAVKRNVRDFCNIVIKEGIDITWSCFTRVNYIDEDLFKLMKKAGCHLVLFGVESGNRKLLDRMNKMITLEQIRKAVKICKKIGLKTRASYIFGAPGETEETVMKTIKFALELDTDYAQFNIMTAYPGTELWEEAEKKGWLIVNNYDYNMSDFSMKLPTISNKKLMEMYKLAHRKFYLRPKVILRQLTDIKSPTDVFQKIKGGLAVLAQI